MFVDQGYKRDRHLTHARRDVDDAFEGNLGQRIQNVVSVQRRKTFGFGGYDGVSRSGGWPGLPRRGGHADPTA